MSTVPERLLAALADRYRIERELGAGGMATVYLAADLKHDRKVAIKVLKRELAAVLGAERFVVEIKTTAALNHPHILPLFDSGEADGFLYYVMPYIRGETIREKLNREAQFGIDEAVRIATEVADALDYAHRNGVIHRDIKPENILLHDGRPMVMDFGIALAVSAAAGGRMTETGLSIGTPHYMSPEQATADKQITARSDAYSLASVLYEMLAGEPPHTGGSAQAIIMKIIAERAQPVTELRSSVPPNVAAALACALEKVPADRFDTARAFADALRNPAFAAASAATLSDAPAEPLRRSVLMAAVAAGAVLGAVAAATWLGGDAHVGERNRDQVTFNGRAMRPAISPDGDLIAYVETRCERGQFAWCKSALVLQEVGGTQPRTLLRDAPFLWYPRWSHDGQSIVIGGRLDSDRAGLFAVSRRSGTVQPLVEGRYGTYDTHPSGDSVVMMRPANGVRYAIVAALATGAVVDSVPMPFVDAQDITWSPNGRLIAAAVDRNVVWITDRAGGLVDSLTIGGLRQSIRWSVDGRSLLFFQTGAAREDAFLRLRVSRAGTINRAPEVVLSRVPTLYTGSFDIARRSGSLAVGTGDATTDNWSFDWSGSGVRTQRETFGTSWYGLPDLSSDGARMFYYRGDALGDNVYQLDRATGTEQALTAERTPGANEVRLSADDRRLAFGRQTGTGTRLQQMEFPSRRVATGPPTYPGRVTMPVAPHGFLTRGADPSSLLRLDSLQGTWEPVAVPDLQSIASFASSPDGALIAMIGIGQPDGGAPGASPRFVVGTIPRTGGPMREVGGFPLDDVAPSLTWDRDGEVSIARWRNEDQHASAWRLTLADGALSRIAELQVPCFPGSVVIRARARAAVCHVRELRGDVWLFDVVGVAR